MSVDNGYHPPHIVPSMPVSSVIHAVEQAYSFRVESHKQLEGFLDMNVYVKASNAFNEDAQTTAEHGYVVKVLELGRSQKIGLVGGQLCMMEHLRRCGIPTPLPVVQVDGSKMCFLRQLEDGSNQIRPIADAPEDGHLLCCLEFVPGMIIKSVPFTARLMFASGEFLAEISEALTSFKHDSFNGVTDISYMERTGTDLLALTWAVTSNEDRAIVEEVLRTVQMEVLDKSDGLRRGFVHGDFNERNVLVKPSSSGVEGDYEVCGLIDFEHSHEGLVALDLAMWLGYSMIGADALPPLETAGHVLAGYLSRRTLLPAELRVLRLGAAARMVHSVTVCSFTIATQPGGNRCSETCLGRALPALRRFWAAPVAEVESCWSRILSEYGLELVSELV